MHRYDLFQIQILSYFYMTSKLQQEIGILREVPLPFIESQFDLPFLIEIVGQLSPTCSPLRISEVPSFLIQEHFY